MKSKRWAGVLVAGAVVAAAAGGSVRAAPSAQAASPVTLQVWDWGSPPPKAMQVVIDSFQQSHPTIKIKIVHQPFNTVFTGITAGVGK